VADNHLLGDPGENGGFEKITLEMFRSIAADNDLSAFALGIVDVFEDLFNSSLVDERPLGCGRIKAKSEFKLSDPRF